MACCDEPVPQGMTIDYRDLPEETFCCMGRVSYTLACIAEELCAGRTHPSWSDLNERQKLQMGAKAKAILTGELEPAGTIEQLMDRFLKVMATTG